MEQSGLIDQQPSTLTLYYDIESHPNHLLTLMEDRDCWRDRHMKVLASSTE